MLKFIVLFFFLNHLMVHTSNICTVQAVDDYLKIMNFFFSFFRENFALRKIIFTKLKKKLIKIKKIYISYVRVSKSFLPFNNKY